MGVLRVGKGHFGDIGSAVTAAREGDTVSIGAGVYKEQHGRALLEVAEYPNIFGTFSPERLFTPVGTNQMRINFFQPGSTWPATVKGFGAVFTDVDLANSTKIELYDQWGGLIWWQNVPKGQQANKSLSFLGVKTDADIYEVRITTGNRPLGASNNDGGSWDVVVMDDFLYAEPQPL